MFVMMLSGLFVERKKFVPDRNPTYIFNHCFIMVFVKIVTLKSFDFRSWPMTRMWVPTVKLSTASRLVEVKESSRFIHTLAQSTLKSLLSEALNMIYW